MRLGLATNCLGRISAKESAHIIKQAGLDGIQLSPADISNGSEARSAQQRPNPEACEQVRAAYESQGLQIYALDAYADIGTADRDRRLEQVAYVKSLMPIARKLGTHILVTSVGPRGIGAYERAVESMQSIMPYAHEQDVMLALEPSYSHCVCCSEKARAFIEEVGYNRLKVAVDPAAILVYDSLDRMFSILGGLVLLGHGRDVTVDATGKPTFCSPGRGQMDYHRYIELLLRHGVDLLIIKHVTAGRLKPVSDFLRKTIADVQGSG